MNEIIVALITGGCAVIGTVISNRTTTNQIQKKLEIAQAVTDEKISELTREVREHNNFAQRMPVVENEIKHINEEIHKLEGYHK